MAKNHTVTRGGKKHVWKTKGRQPVRKGYQEYCREQHRQGLVASSGGNWQPCSNLSQKIAEVYESLRMRLGTGN